MQIEIRYVYVYTNIYIYTNCTYIYIYINQVAFGKLPLLAQKGRNLSTRVPAVVCRCFPDLGAEREVFLSGPKSDRITIEEDVLRRRCLRFSAGPLSDQKCSEFHPTTQKEWRQEGANNNQGVKEYDTKTTTTYSDNYNKAERGKRNT